MENNTWYCEHCEAEFTPKPGGKKPRCHTCMRTTGLTALSTDAPARKVPTQTLIGVAALALAAGGLLWFYATQRAESPPDEAPAPGATVVAPSDSPPTDPTPPVEPPAPAAPTTAVGKFATAAVVGAGSDAAKLRQLLTTIHTRITIIKAGAPLGRDVLRPDAAAKRLSDATDRVPMHAIEVGALTLAAVRALGYKAAVSVLPTGSAGRTSVGHRHLGVIADVTGLDGMMVPSRSGVTDAAEARPAPEAAVEAHLLALEALRAVEQHSFDTGAEIVGKALALAADDQGLHFLRGHLLVLRGQLDAGVELLQTAVVKAEDAEGRYMLAVALLREEETFAAYRALLRTVELDAEHARGWSALGQITLDRMSQVPQGQRPALETELDRVEAALTKINKAAPGLIELRVQRLVAKGKDADARALAVEALNAHPRRAPLHMLMAQMAQIKGETAIAERHYERAAESDPEDAEPLIQLAQIYSQRQETDNAIKALEDAARRAPFDANLMSELVGAYDQTGRSEDAVKMATELRTRFPDLLDGPVLLAQLMLAKGNLQGAIGLLEETLVKHPKEPQLYVLLYFVHVSSNKAAEADAVLKRLMKFDPQGRMRIAQQLLQGMQVEAAVTLMEAELKEKPENIQVAITLAQIHRLGAHDKDVARLRAHVGKHAEDKETTLRLFDEAMVEIDKQAPAQGSGLPPTDAPAAP